MSHWLDDVARGLAEGRHSRRDLLRRGGAVAAGSILAPLAHPLAAIGAAKCTDASCPDGTCCEGRCLTDSSFGCCHDKIYFRTTQHCCSEHPAGRTHVCPDGKDCCGKDECCDPDHICCGTGQCIPNKSGNIGCCNGFTYNKREDRCCPEHKKDEAHFCAKDEECCGKDSCCKKDEICCGTGQCIPNKSGNIGCCNGFTYNKREDQCCAEYPEGEAHFCAKEETCCGEKACCKAGQECCGSGGKEHCVPKGKCKQNCGKPGFPPSYVACGATCCGGSTPVCCNSPQGAACCQSGQVCCGGPTAQCVTPYPAGDWHLGNYDGSAGQEVACCPSGSAGTCGTNPGESHPACRGGNFGCVCTKGGFCPVGGCCDVNGNCLNPCPG